MYHIHHNILFPYLWSNSSFVIAKFQLCTAHNLKPPLPPGPPSQDPQLQSTLSLVQLQTAARTRMVFVLWLRTTHGSFHTASRGAGAGAGAASGGAAGAGGWVGAAGAGAAGAGPGPGPGAGPSVDEAGEASVVVGPASGKHVAGGGAAAAMAARSPSKGL